MQWSNHARRTGRRTPAAGTSRMGARGGAGCAHGRLPPATAGTAARFGFHARSEAPERKPAKPNENADTPTSVRRLYLAGSCESCADRWNLLSAGDSGFGD